MPGIDRPRHDAGLPRRARREVTHATPRCPAPTVVPYDLFDPAVSGGIFHADGCATDGKHVGARRRKTHMSVSASDPRLRPMVARGGAHRDAKKRCRQETMVYVLHH